MKFCTHYTKNPLLGEKEFPPSETDGSQNETISQMVKRFTSMGLVVPDVVFEDEKSEEVNDMLDGKFDDITQADDFDLADVAIIAEDAKKSQQILSEINETVDNITPKSEKTQQEPKMAQETAQEGK